MNCPNCKAWNHDDEASCAYCGLPLQEPDPLQETFCKDGSIRYRVMISNIMARHSVDETERYFAMGTPSEETAEKKVKNAMPKPWFFARVLVLSLVAYLGFYAGLFYFENINFLPGLIFIGSFITPISLLIFFWEINLPQNISMFKLLLFLLEGGLVALLYTVSIYSLLDGHESPLMIGIIEEGAKALTLLLLLRRERYPSILNGLLIGAAIGTGFAAIESSGYILVSALQYGVPTMLRTIYWRGLLAPGGHIAWAGLMGAAMMMTAKPKYLPPIFHLKFLGMYALVVLLHALWDAEIPQPILMNLPLYPIVLTIISWILLFAMMKRGLKQTLCHEEEPKQAEAPPQAL